MFALNSKTCRWIVVFSAVVFATLCIIFYGFTIDDTFISLRYARNFADGHGLRFSLGGDPPVEGYTNFLWVALQALLFTIGFGDDAVVHAVKVMGIAFGLGTVLATGWLASRCYTTRGGAASATILMGTSPFLALWSVGGLETPMFTFFAVMAVTRLLAEYDDRRSHIGSFIFLLALALSRPEGVGFSLACLAMLIVRYCFDRDDGQDWRRAFRCLTPGIFIFGLVYGLYFCWRWNYYGLPFPNTFYAKQADWSLLHIWSRLNEMSGLLITMIPFAVVIVAGQALSGLRNIWPRLVVAGAFVALLVSAFTAYREWMPGFRYEVPMLPFWTCLTAISIVTLQRRLLSRISLAASRAGIVILTTLLCLAQLTWTDEYRGQQEYTERLEHAHISLGKWLKEYAPADASYAGWDMGAVPYYSHIDKIIDIHPEGLLNRETALKQYSVRRLLAQRPSFIVLPRRPDDSRKRRRGMHAFYDNPDFKQQYQYVFKVTFRADYVLNLYRRSDVELSNAAVAAGMRLEALSWQRNGQP